MLRCHDKTGHVDVPAPWVPVRNLEQDRCEREHQADRQERVHRQQARRRALGGWLDLGLLRQQRRHCLERRLLLCGSWRAEMRLGCACVRVLAITCVRKTRRRCNRRAARPSTWQLILYSSEIRPHSVYIVVQRTITLSHNLRTTAVRTPVHRVILHAPARLTALDSTLQSSRTSWSRCSSSSASSPLLFEMTRDVNLCNSVPRTQNLPVPYRQETRRPQRLAGSKPGRPCQDQSSFIGAKSDAMREN